MDSETHDLEQVTGLYWIPDTKYVVNVVIEDLQISCTFKTYPDSSRPLELWHRLRCETKCVPAVVSWRDPGHAWSALLGEITR